MWKNLPSQGIAIVAQCRANLRLSNNPPRRDAIALFPTGRRSRLFVVVQTTFTHHIITGSRKWSLHGGSVITVTVPDIN